MQGVAIGAVEVGGVEVASVQLDVQMRRVHFALLTIAGRASVRRRHGAVARRNRARSRYTSRCGVVGGGLYSGDSGIKTVYGEVRRPGGATGAEKRRK
jgi:hypothetical protein